MDKSHDPREFIRGIQQILINNTIRIGFLFGAGTSMAAPLTDKDGKDLFDDKHRHLPLIPGVWAMTEKIVASIKEICSVRHYVLLKKNWKRPNLMIKKNRLSICWKTLFPV
jgi:hypothetical protein